MNLFPLLTITTRSRSLLPACSRYSATTDPVLSYIASSLATIKPYQRSVTGGSDYSASSGLPDDMSQWLVEWDEIRLEHPIGKGSFGWVRPRRPLARGATGPVCWWA